MHVSWEIDGLTRILHGMFPQSVRDGRFVGQFKFQVVIGATWQWRKSGSDRLRGSDPDVNTAHYGPVQVGIQHRDGSLQPLCFNSPIGNPCGDQIWISGGSMRRTFSGEPTKGLYEFTKWQVVFLTDHLSIVAAQRCHHRSEGIVDEILRGMLTLCHISRQFNVSCLYFF